MPRLSVMGHPVHPILQAIPAAVLPASTAFDALARVSEDSEGLSRAGHYTLIFGLLGAAGAAATGVLDYYEIENRPVRRVALYHGLVNAALISCYAACLVRRRKTKRADNKGLVLSGAGTALVGLSGYLGGELVYEHGVRVGEDADGIPGAA
ncbi:putative membrane protein [Rubrobacter radiotolerans]|uniref:DUF2231 domain-containing protein n=1 Tax=Rubrobacter radiotolerans TaxID=42256 RepID=A0A023X061_RUBRA|nr:DUF2231 domain-containing protein [Rubrobacter radiotolerans]AHY45410.1 putative membrane protein [Rubrobacter radiotolerans]MDX5892821.1 DUF2231 domain-containing protein [Rubrobacter radiotolerans]SMC02559.1 Uncharacterized membrane protein [Rubrobacter radiotolerans DSM 5868]